MNVIECNALTKKHRRVKALNEISFSIEENKITGLIGPNGAGKTTLLKILAGFWRKSSGDVTVFTENPFNSVLVSANSIFIDDQINFPTALTLAEILMEAERIYPNFDKQLAFRLFDYFSFVPNQIHNNLSKGKKSTFNMILGLSARCPITIFDEPTTGMDISVRKDFYRALLKDYIAHPRSIIISSHHVEEMVDILEDILFIKDGRKVLHLSIDDMKEYAIGATGGKENINVLTNNREVFFRKEVRNGDVYVVVRNDLSDRELEDLDDAGITLQPITISELYVYLTNDKKGGIDDVFDNA